MEHEYGGFREKEKKFRKIQDCKLRGVDECGVSKKRMDHWGNICEKLIQQYLKNVIFMWDGNPTNNWVGPQWSSPKERVLQMWPGWCTFALNNIELVGFMSRDETTSLLSRQSSYCPNFD